MAVLPVQPVITIVRAGTTPAIRSTNPMTRMRKLVATLSIPCKSTVAAAGNTVHHESSLLTSIALANSLESSLSDPAL